MPEATANMEDDMEGGMICTCCERDLEQLGEDTSFTNFHCRCCGTFVHAHHPEDMDPTPLCADCYTIAWHLEVTLDQVC